MASSPRIARAMNCSDFFKVFDSQAIRKDRFYSVSFLRIGHAVPPLTWECPFTIRFRFVSGSACHPNEYYSMKHFVNIPHLPLFLAVIVAWTLESREALAQLSILDA